MATITKMLFMSFAFLSSAFLARSGEVDYESEFSYVENAEINGPANWSNIHPNWIKCKTGKMQSPIDFPNNKVEIVSNLGILQKFYKPSNATLLNRGHDIMLRWDDGGFLKINGTQYRLKQVHWHTPSEHTIDGKRFDMEGHLVHETNDGKNIAVIGILYEIGLFPDLFLTMIEKDLEALRLADQKAIGINYPNLIKIDEKRYYRYMGSLTVPACTENVIWTIDGKSPIDLDNKMVEVVSNLGILQKYYKPSNATLVNRGHDIMLRWDGDSGYLKIDETQYQLQQIHWHTPSEHSIDGKRYDMEAHLVHMSSDGKIAVIGILYEIGLLPNDLLTILEGDLVALADKRSAEKAMGIHDPNIIKLDDNIYYRYIGSLTTPPCTEGVVWTIDGKVNSVTASQIKLLQDAAVNIEKDLKALANTKGVERAIGRINPKQIKIDGKKYYRYIGSLTVPPCTEGVIWTMDRKVKTVTKRQMKLIRDAVHDESESNARPAQPLNKRPIRLYKPEQIEMN
ncbi:hypothetical protein MTR67_029186 [Solanum verrucosum]|uniref:Carbonic anhydrase n=1 Tax=Solanum verrucosum TaxID=315347 RepID=A0AAF0RCB2_SOLVR|nr:hypothetical protein MTR67_029186 [Solanum verrucosum]